MSKADYSPDPDDMFSDTRMTFGDHIEDLRTHLLRAIYGFVVCMLLSFFIAQWVLGLIAAPVEDQLGKFYQRYNAAQAKEVKRKLEDGTFRDLPAIQTPIQIDADDLRKWLRREIGDFKAKEDEFLVLPHLMPAVERLLERLGLDQAIDRKILSDEGRWIELQAKIPNPLDVAEELQKTMQILRPPKLSTLRVEEAFFVYFKVAILTGFVLSSPWVFYQIWSFIAAGLYPNEKRLVNVYLPFSLGLFLVGVFVCQFLVIPRAIEALLWFNEWLGFQPDLRLNEWLGFAILMPLVFGISFQTPLVMLFLFKVGIFDVDSYRSKRRIAWFLMAVFAAVITPSVDAFSMLLLWVPMSLLYELGILLCKWLPHEPDELEDSTLEGEMVEV